MTILRIIAVIALAVLLALGIAIVAGIGLAIHDEIRKDWNNNNHPQNS